MTDIFSLVRHDLLEPAGLTDHQLAEVLHKLAGKNIDYADLYFQSTYVESWALEDGIIKSGSFDIDRGVGVRAMSGEKTGFAYADDIIFPAIDQAAAAARSIANTGGENQLRPGIKAKLMICICRLIPCIHYQKQRKRVYCTKSMRICVRKMRVLFK